MRLAASSGILAHHKTSTTVEDCLSRSCYSTFSNLQLQSGLPGASQPHALLRRRANVSYHSRLQTRIAGASHQINERFCAGLTIGKIPRFAESLSFELNDFCMQSSSGYGVAHILPTSSSKECSDPSIFLRF